MPNFTCKHNYYLDPSTRNHDYQASQLSRHAQDSQMNAHIHLPPSGSVAKLDLGTWRLQRLSLARINYRRNWLLSTCAYNTRQQENMRLIKSMHLTGSMRLIKSAKTR